MITALQDANNSGQMEPATSGKKEIACGVAQETIEFEKEEKTKLANACKKNKHGGNKEKRKEAAASHARTQSKMGTFGFRHNGIQLPQLLNFGLPQLANSFLNKDCYNKACDRTKQSVSLTDIFLNGIDSRKKSICQKESNQSFQRKPHHQE
ncbi:hypothetical protein VNO80_30240 [Phaseolus coccineus]|uniref:Uncharacterized protein n=1 Tax=Phaseolus coccineus TaxID=3886 RepID=A0AAN9LCW9_PHACN